jgi:hypothetical protein
MASPDLMSRDYINAARVALSVQIPVAMLCMLVLDRGWTARICGGAMLGFWLAAAFVASRRPWNPSTADLWFWRWGFLPCFVAAVALAVAISR